MKDKKMQKVTILKTFHDKDNFSIVHREGTEVEFTAERAAHLKYMGVAGFEEPQGTVETSGTIAPLGTVGTAAAIDLSGQWQEAVAAVKKCESLDALTMAHDKETACKNRKSVVEALKARIAEIQDSGLRDDKDVRDDSEVLDCFVPRNDDKTTGDDE
jgi:hypothetical protein